MHSADSEHCNRDSRLAASRCPAACRHPPCMNGTPPALCAYFCFVIACSLPCALCQGTPLAVRPLHEALFAAWPLPSPSPAISARWGRPSASGRVEAVDGDAVQASPGSGGGSVAFKQSVAVTYQSASVLAVPSVLRSAKQGRPAAGWLADALLPSPWGQPSALSGPPLAGTHSGSFHCDEALGCFLLQQTTKFGGADIVRSRDPEVLKGLDVVIDVGGVYDPGAPASLAASQGAGRPSCTRSNWFGNYQWVISWVRAAKLGAGGCKGSGCEGSGWPWAKAS